MSEESLRILVEFIGAILVAFITYFFTRSHYERKRRDDLADRDFNIRMEATNKKLEEVHAYLNDYLEAANLVISSELDTVIRRTVVKSKADLDKITDLLQSTTKRMPNVALLNDSELLNLNGEWLINFRAEHTNLMNLIDAIRRDEVVDQSAITLRIAEFSGKTGVLYAKMKTRLDKLSQTPK